MSLVGSTGKVRRWFEDEFARGLGYHAYDSDQFGEIRDALVASIEETHTQTRRKRLDILMDLARTSPDSYWHALNGGSRLHNIPDFADDLIFLSGDPENIAAQVFALPTGQWHDFLAPIKERIGRQEYLARQHNDSHSTERDWFVKFKGVAQDLATTATAIRREQILSAISGGLGFLDQVNDEENME